MNVIRPASKLTILYAIIRVARKLTNRRGGSVA